MQCEEQEVESESQEDDNLATDGAVEACLFNFFDKRRKDTKWFAIWSKFKRMPRVNRDAEFDLLLEQLNLSRAQASKKFRALVKPTIHSTVRGTLIIGAQDSP